MLEEDNVSFRFAYSLLEKEDEALYPFFVFFFGVAS